MLNQVRLYFMTIGCLWYEVDSIEFIYTDSKLCVCVENQWYCPTTQILNRPYKYQQLVFKMRSLNSLLLDY